MDDGPIADEDMIPVHLPLGNALKKEVKTEIKSEPDLIKVKSEYKANIYGTGV